MVVATVLARYVRRGGVGARAALRSALCGLEPTPTPPGIASQFQVSSKFFSAPLGQGAAVGKWSGRCGDCRGERSADEGRPLRAALPDGHLEHRAGAVRDVAQVAVQGQTFDFLVLTG